MVATLAAAFAPAAETAVVLPQVVEAAAAVLAPNLPAVVVPLQRAAEGVTEAPELLALGAEIGPRLAAYRDAAATLVEARAKASDLWPAIALTTNRQRGFFGGCFDFEQDLDGKDFWPEVVMGPASKCLVRPPTQVMRAEPLRALLEELRSAPDEFDPELDADVAALLDIVTAYEPARPRARAVLTAAADRCDEAAR